MKNRKTAVLLGAAALTAALGLGYGLLTGAEQAEESSSAAGVAGFSATGAVSVICYVNEGGEMAREYLDMGLSLGIGGVLTFKNARKLVEVVEYAPLESLLLETDSPYLAPVPNRGKRNSSLNIPYVVEKIAEIKGVSQEEVEEVTWKNSFRVFGKVK